MANACSLIAEPFDSAQELARFSHGAVNCGADCGAIASFTGIARAKDGAGEEVTGLFLDHHPRMTLLSMEAIHADALARFPLIAARIIHRHGLILPGEAIVFVAAASSHRRAAFDAVDYMMDRLKTEAVFWKREESGASSQWIEPTEADYAARDAWSSTGESAG